MSKLSLDEIEEQLKTVSKQLAQTDLIIVKDAAFWARLPTLLPPPNVAKYLGLEKKYSELFSELGKIQRSVKDFIKAVDQL